ncbi:O-antigen ligase family protein [Pseudoalteromonas sp. TB51]|uniref:O-antigen ligase family protein n=1 Tax=Pseudoalteromonas sp. TB51 TaxID=1055803 RepID=UPI00040438C7|nr:O-antigen ligase family protein [Pseudoalteromonas sp. TB51]
MTLKKLKDNIAEVFLGLALGTGYLTSYRFLGPVGISELLFSVVFLILIRAYYGQILNFKLGRVQYFNLYLVFTFIIILPVITIVSYTSDVSKSEPLYLLSYFLGGLFVIILFFAQKSGFNFKIVTYIFSLTFIVSNLFFLATDIGSGRYSGGADNPNQLLFYGTSLSLLISIYLESKWQAFIFPILIFIMLKTGSDAYNLSIFVSVVIYIASHLIFYKRYSISVGIILGSVFLIVFSVLCFVYLKEAIIISWYSADEGGTRLSLFSNAITVIQSSPFFGYGAGSFSGLHQPWQGKEAHNTFLDLATQFGVFFPLFLYTVMIIYFIQMLRVRRFWVAGFTAAYIIGTMFHFSARHFVFWIEISIFYFACFSGQNRYKDIK